MTEKIVHRGPDGHGIWTDGGLAFGHRRLAILDLSNAGHQPMQSSCGRYVLIFNGEIYNHHSLRRELEFAGSAPNWVGHSDTETLLAGFAHWGVEATLARSSGMFALALWDKRDNVLHLARDRLGEKPLYYGWGGSTFLFASELKALRAHPEFKAEISNAALAQYLRYSYVPAPYSIYERIFKLEPGCVLRLEGLLPSPLSSPLRPGERHGSLSVFRYWSLLEATSSGLSDPFASDDEAVDCLDRTLTAAVSRQLLSDVPVGAFLSGGVDSSTIVALMQKVGSGPTRTFTVAFDQKDFDESRHAAQVARHLGTEHSEIRVTDRETRSIIPFLPDCYDEPFADSSQIPTYFVCKGARSGAKVALSGDGADELFGGYNRYLWGPRTWLHMSRVPAAARKLVAAGLTAVPAPVWEAVGACHNFLAPPASGVSRFAHKAQRIATRLGSATDLDGFYRDLVTEWPNPPKVMATRDRQLEQDSDVVGDSLPVDLFPGAAERMMYLDALTYLPDDILCKVDRAAMSVSLETRAPFLDPDVVAVAARLPGSMKLREKQGKWALRQVLYHYVPRTLIERPKVGFSVPIGSWLRGSLREWAESLLSETNLSTNAFLDARPIRNAWSEHLSGRFDWSARLWIVLMFLAWQQAAEL